MECARCSRALLPLKPLSQRVSKKGKKAVLRISHEKYRRTPLSKRVSKKGEKISGQVMKNTDRSIQATKSESEQKKEKKVWDKSLEIITGAQRPVSQRIKKRKTHRNTNRSAEGSKGTFKLIPVSQPEYV